MFLGFQFNGSKSGVWNLHHYLVKAAEHAMPDDPIIHGWRNLKFEDVVYDIEPVQHEVFTHKVTVQLSNAKLANREKAERYIQLPNLSQYIKFDDSDFDWYIQNGWVFEDAPKQAEAMLAKKLHGMGILGDHLSDLSVTRMLVGEQAYIQYTFKSYSFDWVFNVELPEVAEGVSKEVLVTFTFSDMESQTI